MPLDLSDIALDPDLGEAVTVLRSTGSFVAGGWQSNAPTQIPMWGVLVPADAEALQQVPEGDRVTGSLQFICRQQIYETQAARGGLSDKIQWRGNIYRVINVQPWGDNGFWTAILARMTGA